MRIGFFERDCHWERMVTELEFQKCSHDARILKMGMI
jgi:hypothetical protein